MRPPPPLRPPKTKVARLKAHREQTRRAVRDLAARMESERAAFRGLEAQVKGHLKAMPEVASAGIGAVQASCWGVELAPPRDNKLVFFWACKAATRKTRPSSRLKT